MATVSSHVVKRLHLQVPADVITGVGLIGVNIPQIPRFVAAG